jgi:AcrR family transcriptional regulator
LAGSERRLKERQARRADILAAARDVFFSKGFMAATMEDIADHAEISKGAIYLHFQSKEELYGWVLAEGLDILYDQYWGPVSGLRESPAQRLLALGEAYLTFYKDHRAYFDVMFLIHQGSQLVRVPRHLYEVIVGKANTCLAILDGILRDGAEQKLFQMDDSWKVTNTIWGMWTGVILLAESGKARSHLVSLEELYATCQSMVLRSLLRREPLLEVSHGSQ